MFKRLWNDDKGAIMSQEFILMSGLLVTGLSGGMMSLRDSINQNYEQIGKNIQVAVPKDINQYKGLTISQTVAQSQNLINYNYVIVNPPQP